MAIPVADGFNITTNIPVDKRFIFNTVAERDALSELERYEGLVTYVKEGALLCHLKGGITNDKWFPVGEGNITGPASSVDNATAVFDGETGKSLRATGVKIDSNDNITGVSDLSSVSLTTTIFSLGASDVDGSWRFIVDEDSALIIQRRESGSWVPKQKLGGI